MKNILKYTLLLILFSMLILIRAFETDLFYDPLIEFFKNDYLYKRMPEVNDWELITNVLFRYILNSLISLAIINVIFKNKKHLKYAGFFHMFMCIILIIMFMYLLRNRFESGYLVPFYVRRFLIHPIFLFLLLPAFYYYRLKRKA